MPRGVIHRDADWLAQFDTAARRHAFWDRVVIRRAHQCWTWAGAKETRGYGLLSLGGSHQISAHRYSYFIEYGGLPSGLVVRHSCDNPSCINPRHLLAGTHSDNTNDMYARGRSRWHRGNAIREKSA